MSEDVRVSGEPGRSGLRRLAISGAGWTLLRFGGRSGLRLGGNLVLTRLLFPEAFGLMALVNVTLEALELFSDVGLRQSVVSNARGSEAAFLRTVWTVQVVRGFAIFGVALLLAFPVARLYGEPELAGLIAFASFTALSRGFTSARVHLLARQLALRRIALIELGVQFCGLLVMGLYAWLHPSVWVLPAGAVVGRTLFCIASHVLMPGPTMRLSWDPAVRAELMGFGRWILISSVLGYLVNSLDRIILGSAMSLAELGTYTVALMFVRVVLQIERRLRDEVMYPLIARITSLPKAAWRRALLRARLGIVAVTHPVLLVLAVFGPELIYLLYDDRYLSAGWMLQILATGFLVKATVEPMDSVLLAHGDSFRFMQLLAVRSFVLCLAMVVAMILYGTSGLVAAVAFAEILAYPAVVWCTRRYGAWIPAFDLAVVSTSLLIGGLALYLKGIWL